MTSRLELSHRVAGAQKDIVRFQITVENLVLVQQLHAICHIK